MTSPFIFRLRRSLHFTPGGWGGSRIVALDDMTSRLVRACLFAVVLAHTLSTRGGWVSGEDKPRPRWELKDKPSVWESTWKNCDDDGGEKSGGGTYNAGGAGGGLFSVKDVIPSPGSFAGRTGHSGSTKFVVDTNGKRVEDVSRRAVSPAFVCLFVWFFFVISLLPPNPTRPSFAFLDNTPLLRSSTARALEREADTSSSRHGVATLSLSLSLSLCPPSHFFFRLQGRVIRQASYEGHSSASETMDLCEWTEDCPLGPGDRVTFAGKRLKVPWYSPPGNYKFKYKLQDKHGALLFCAEVDLRCVPDPKNGHPSRVVLLFGHHIFTFPNLTAVASPAPPPVFFIARVRRMGCPNGTKVCPGLPLV